MSGNCRSTTKVSRHLKFLVPHFHQRISGGGAKPFPQSKTGSARFCCLRLSLGQKQWLQHSNTEKLVSQFGTVTPAKAGGAVASKPPPSQKIRYITDILWRWHFISGKSLFFILWETKDWFAGQILVINYKCNRLNKILWRLSGEDIMKWTEKFHF